MAVGEPRPGPDEQGQQRDGRQQQPAPPAGEIAQARARRKAGGQGRGGVQGQGGSFVPVRAFGVTVGGP